MCTAIRKEAVIEKGAKHLLYEVQLVRDASFLTLDAKTEIQNCLEYNSYYCHPHCVLIAMLG